MKVALRAVAVAVAVLAASLSNSNDGVPSPDIGGGLLLILALTLLPLLWGARDGFRSDLAREALRRWAVVAVVAAVLVVLALALLDPTASSDPPLTDALVRFVITTLTVGLFGAAGAGLGHVLGRSR